MKKLESKIALVTGGTSGIGESIAREFAMNGAITIISGRNLERGKKIISEITADNNVADFIQCDTSKEDSIKKLINIISDKYGRLDILVNNAGVFFTSSIENQNVEDWDYMFDVNVRGYFLVSKYSLPLLLKSKSSVIINNSSVAGMQSFISGQSYAYSSSKAAVIQFSRALALNYGKEGVRVNSICPGIIETPLFQGRDISNSSSKIPLGRVGNPKEIASVASFLASDDASYIHGATITVDGGLSL